LLLVIVLVAVWVTCHHGGVGLNFPALSTRPTLAGSATVPVDLMAGSWEGTWANEDGDMGGALTCQVTPLGGDQYETKFHAVFAKVLTYDMDVTLIVKRDGPVWSFHGQKDLGLLGGGLYTYDGHTDGQEFFSKYDSQANKGTYKLMRPRKAPATRTSSSVMPKN
jgi:hypothetical protein